MRRRPAGGVVALLVVVLLVAGCGSGGGSPAASSASTTPSSPAPSSSSVGVDPGYSHRYVAMGDSYTAAPGVPPQDPNDPCLRSSRSYPYLLHDQIRPDSFVDVSCSGAQTTDLTGSQTAGGATLAPQLDAVTAGTDLVTIGIGGNDFALFGTLVGTCAFLGAGDPTGSPCTERFRTTGGGDGLTAHLPTITARIAAVVRTVRAKAPKARVLLVGYPQIVPAHGTCPALLPIASGDYPYARRINLGLTRAVQRAASETGATYVDVWSASAGHDICAAHPWINGRTSTDRAAPYHPFEVEQQAVAGLIQRALAG